MNSGVQRMVEEETDRLKTVPVYSLDQETAYIIWFYLNSTNDPRFQVKMVKEPSSHRFEYWLTKKMFPTIEVNNLTGLEGEHFWVVFAEGEWKGNRSPQSIFREAGYRVGDLFEEGLQDRKTILFPVWRRT